MATPHVQVTVDRVNEVAQAIAVLGTHRVLVGIPQDKSARSEGGISSAALAYIHENGAPEANIPARPFMRPTVKAEQGSIVKDLRRAGDLAFAGKSAAVLQQLHKMGMRVRDAIKKRIVAGLEPPLKPATIAARRRRSPGSSYRRVATQASQVKPLIDTGAMLNSISYVVRKTTRSRT